MSNKNNTIEQKAAWKTNKRLGSRAIKVTPSPAYKPEPKTPSRRDMIRRGDRPKNNTEWKEMK